MADRGTQYLSEEYSIPSKRLACCTGEPLHTDGLGMEEAEVDPPQHPKKRRSVYTNEILYGIINAIVGAPTMISFAAIVYQVPLRESYPTFSLS